MGGTIERTGTSAVTAVDHVRALAVQARTA